MNKEELLELIQKQGVLPLFYHDDFEVCKQVVTALYNAGIRAIEFTNRGVHALSHFGELVTLANQNWPALQLGIGTVIDGEDASRFADAGAAFIVCPGVVPSVAQVCNKNNLLWMPGCLTPTEIIMAKTNGARLVKIFPGSLVGPSYITAIKDVFSDLLFMPTGGVEVSEASMGAWFAAGVCAVGLGSKVISKEALAKKDYASIEALTKEAISIVDSIRQKKN